MAPEAQSPLAAYTRRAEQLSGSLERTQRWFSARRTILLILALLALVTLYQSFIAKNIPPWAIFVIVPFAVVLAERTQRLKHRLLGLSSLSDYYDKGIARLTRNWKSLDRGSEFQDSDHPYASDLDLFGGGSLFQLLCSCRTQAGRETLAAWIKSPATPDEVLSRQAAISELRERQDLRESIASAAVKIASDFKPSTFRDWTAAPASRLSQWLAPVAFFFSLAALVLPILFWSGRIGLGDFWLGARILLPLEAICAAVFLRQSRKVNESSNSISVELPVVYELLRIMEHETFSAPGLVALRNRLMNQGLPASASIRRLKLSIYFLKERDNPWFTMLSYPLMWGTQFTMAIDRWRRHHSAQLLQWLAAIGEFEALVSLATYSYEHPADVFPELADGFPSLVAEGLTHPFLDETTCVRNDLQLGDDLRFWIVSGSNMSGKSTFVRAVGLNVVLAWMGATVRCTKLRCTRLTVGAAIRVQDSVVDGRSHFMAEMQRLRRMISSAAAEPLLFLADEILSGTNSQDRRVATEWVIRALLLRGAIGVVTTHDLALTQIASNGLPAGNVHFEDSGENGNLLFDYKLRPGLLTRSNALNIAHLLGIDSASTKL